SRFQIHEDALVSTSSSSVASRTRHIATCVSRDSAPVIALVSLLAACGGGSTRHDAMNDGFDRRALLEHLGTNVLLPMQATFDAKAAALPGAIETYCNALDAGTPGTAREAAIAAWSEAIDA